MSAAAISQKERRKEVRHLGSLSLLVSKDSGGETDSFALVDISLNGLCFECGELWRPNTVFHFILSIPGNGVVLGSAKVCWSRRAGSAGYLSGAQFQSVGHAYWQKLRLYLEHYR